MASTKALIDLLTEQPEVFTAKIPVELIRLMLDSGDPIEELDLALDEAQADVFSGEREVTYLLLTIVK